MKLFIKLTIFAALLPVSAIADCPTLVEEVVLGIHSDARSHASVRLTQRIMTTLEYEVIVRDMNDDVRFDSYRVRANGTLQSCKIRDITRVFFMNEVTPAPSFDVVPLNESFVSLTVKDQKYTFKKALLDAAILASFPLARDQFPRDKFYHYTAGASAALVANRICYGIVFKKNKHRKLFSNLCGLGSAALAGGLKELYDSKTGGTVEFNDFAATTLGGAVVTLRFTLF